MINIKKKYIKIYLIIIIFAFFNIAMIKNSNAEYSDFEWFNNAPRMTIQTDKNKYTDVKFTFKDLNGFNIDNIKIYTVDSKGNKTAEITNNDKIITKKETSESDKPNVYTTYVYTMSNEFLNKETHRFYIELTDNTNQYLHSYFRIVDNGKGYGVDYAPRIIYWGTNGKKVYFTARDLAGTEELRLYDMNNDKKYDKKWIVKKNNLAKGNAKVTFNLSSFKKKDGMYRIRVYAIDKKNGQYAYREVYFKLKDTSSTNTNINKTVTGISINKRPTKQTYTQNTDELDLSGGEIRVKYSDSSSKIVAMTNKNVKNSGFSNSKVGTIQIKLEYSGKVTSFNVKIIEKSSQSGSTSNTKKLQGKKVELPEGDKVYFLDVQDIPSWSTEVKGSDAIILESNGLFGIIDTGKALTRRRVVRYLKELNVKELDFVIITHNHSDHDGGLKEIGNRGIKIKKFYIKDLANTKAPNWIKNKCKGSINTAKKAGAKIYRVSENSNNEFTFGNMNLKLYNTKNRYKDSNVGGNVNSLGIVATVNGKRIYFSGDIQNDSSRGIYASDETAKEIGKIDVYKAAHHGNYNGVKNNSVTTMSYLKPTYTIITGNKRNYKVKRAAGVIGKYTKSENMYYTPDGTVILNIAPDGNISFKKLKADG